MSKQKTEFEKGCECARDYIICLITGLSNDYNCMPDSKEDKAYTKALKSIEDRCGELFSDWKL